jgi:hypothetical protein
MKLPPIGKYIFLIFFVAEKEFRENYTALILLCKSSSLPDFFLLRDSLLSRRIWWVKKE